MRRGAHRAHSFHQQLRDCPPRLAPRPQTVVEPMTPPPAEVHDQHSPPAFAREPARVPNGQPHLEFREVSAFYGSKQVLRNVNLTVPRNSVIGIIGPANSGKTTLLKTIN